MSLKHTFTCERCDKKVEAKYNGEHYLPPPEWIEILDPKSGCSLNKHLCGRCGERALEKEENPKGYR